MDRLELPGDPLAAELDEFIDLHRLAERGRAVDHVPTFPRPEFEAMGAAGWLGLTTPAAFGGRELPVSRAGVLLHRLAFRSGTVFAKLSLQPEFSSVLREVGSELLVDEWFRPLIAGRRLVGNQITEPEPFSMPTRSSSRPVERLRGTTSLERRARSRSPWRRTRRSSTAG